jgi:heme-degrading monooxygenase HmoA
MPPARNATLYRLDKFIVPEAAKEEFLARMQASQRFLRALPGFVQDFALEQNAGNGMRHYVTLAEWTDAAAVDVACAAIHDWYASSRHLDPQELFAQLGIQADLGNYFPVKASGR